MEKIDFSHCNTSGPGVEILHLRTANMAGQKIENTPPNIQNGYFSRVKQSLARLHSKDRDLFFNNCRP